MTLSTANGRPVHPIGIGTWGIANRINDDLRDGRYRNIEAAPGNEAAEVDGLRYSLSKGQNHFDCAELYGAFYTDEVVGQALESSDVARDDLYIADKLWKTSVGPGMVRPTVEQMLTKLRVDYLDLLYIHAPWPEVDWQAAIPQIDALIDEGVVRHFGVSNFTVAQMQQAQALATHPIAANQMNFNCLYRDEVTDDFRGFCGEQNITVVAYQPVKRGEVLDHPTLMEIARKRAATPVQVALAWLLHQGALPIPKALQPSHVDENLGALEVQLTDEDIAAIASI